MSERDLLVLDEGHLLETELVKFRGLSISKKRWKRYIDNFEIVDYGYDSIERWIDFLIDLETKVLSSIGNDPLAPYLTSKEVSNLITIIQERYPQKTLITKKE